jgi:hypothetical protein
MVMKHGFQETLLAQYRDEIEKILVESESVYRSNIDYEMLDNKIVDLMKCARVDGLDEKALWDLIHARIPSYVNYVNSKMSSKKAA